MAILNPLTVCRGDYRYLRYKQNVECLASDIVGDFVYIRADRNGDLWRVGKADPADESKMPALGVLLSKETSTTGVVQLIGPCTLFSGLDHTKPAYLLGLSGIQTSLPSIGGSGYVMVQQIGKAVASDVLWLTGDLRMTKRI